MKKLVGFVLLLTACAPGLSWPPGSITRLHLRGDAGGPAESHLVTDPAQLDAFAEAVMRAERVDGTSRPEPRPRWRALDISARGGGRWAYDPDAGELTRIAHNRQPVYRLRPEDRLRVNALLALPPEGAAPAPAR